MDLIDEVREQIANQIEEFGNNTEQALDLFKIILIIHATVSITTLLLVVATIIIIALKK